MTRETALARADIYRFLSLAFAYPERDHMESLRDLSMDIEEAIDLLPYDIKDDFMSLRSAIKDMDIDALEPEYTEMFMTRMHCSPVEASYGMKGFNRPNILGDISGFYKAFGFSLSDKAGLTHDHIAVELEFMSFLALKEAYAIEQGMDENLDICVSAKKKFLDEHLGMWAGTFTKNLEMRTNEEFYRRLALMASRFVDEELRCHGIFIDAEGVEELPKEEAAMVCPAAKGRMDEGHLPIQ